MKKNSLYARFSVWGLTALSLVLVGGLLARRGIAQEQPVFVSGTDVAPSYLSSNLGQTIKQMREVYDILKVNDWDFRAVPFKLMKYPDQMLDEKPHKRNPQMGGFIFPNLPLYSDVAVWTDTYFRENLVIYPNRATSNPKGFFLVMFKTGELVRVKPEDVRMYPHPTIPDGLVPVFPGMSVYRDDLPKMPNYQ